MMKFPYGVNKKIKIKLPTKMDLLNWCSYGIGTYIKNDFPCRRDPQNKDSNFPFMRFQVALIHSMSFSLCCPLDDGIAIFYKIVEKIDNILSATIHIDGNVHIHHKECLVHSNRTDEHKKYCYFFLHIYKLTQIMDKPTHIPHTAEHHADLFHISCPDQCSSVVLPPLATSDCSLIAKVMQKPKMSSRVIS